MRSNVHAFHDREVLKADSQYPGPPEEDAAQLVLRLRDEYELGSDSWQNLSDGVLAELRDAGAAGTAAAVWIVRRSLAAFCWELAFWIKETGGTTTDPAAPTAEERATVQGSWHVNPFSAARGIHPYIHLIAALNLLANRPQPAVAGTVAELLELWLTAAEHDHRGVHPRTVLLLESLVACYKAAREAKSAGDTTRETPAYLTDLARRRVSRPLESRRNPGMPRRFAFLTGSCDLSALARKALR
jgi:hypothetical protein